ncbi:translation initiation factor IF3-1, mitochondrial isoform X2 [Coffea eugenioides]|uniref:translation initiation factor IF3-1, mitochondrial isoform X2 n=1 Tax=Coffea eugenioides TaxID=49369 RepID=UPI000F604ACA|nr:translation initiation factor IF3-1, mitochondrial isoform X2 [Coffea eugenioides]
MAFWRRVRRSQIDTKLWNQFSRSYLQIHSPISANRTKISVLHSPSSPGHTPQLDLPTNVRCFAAPVQFMKKKEEKHADGPRLNEQVTADVIRLVTDEGHSVVSRYEALKRARSLELDLVESKVSLRNGGCKEVRFAAKITPNDLQIKADMAKRLMESGYRVKCVAIGNVDKGEDSATLFSRFSALIEDISVVETDTRVEEKDQAHVIMRHVKYGPLKKGSLKRASMDKKAASASVQEVEGDDDVLSEERDDVEQKEISGWTTANADDDFDELFDLNDNADGVSKSSRSEKFSIAREPSSSSEGGSSHYPRPGGRDTLQSGPQFPDRVRQPPLNMNASPQRRKTEGVNHAYPASTNSRNHGQNFAPNNPDPQGPSYGVFRARQGNDAHGKQNAPAEVNRYKQRNAPDSRRNSSPPRAAGHQNGPMSNFKFGREQAVNRDEQGRWGVFSGESTNVIPNRTFDGQAKVQR